jgi:hypothetical protein
MWHPLPRKRCLIILSFWLTIIPDRHSRWLPLEDSEDSEDSES